jgi:hypothetical protein
VSGRNSVGQHNEARAAQYDRSAAAISADCDPISALNVRPPVAGSWKRPWRNS